MSRTRRTVCGAAVAALASLVVLAPSAVAGAEVTGPCRISVDGTDIGALSSSDPGDALVVGADDRFSVTFDADAGLSSHAIDLHYAGFTWPVAEGTDRGGSTRTKYVSVADYRRYGVGLYQVSGRATLDDGTTCEGAVLVRVTGTPLKTAAGIGALVVALAGAAGVGATAVNAARGARRAGKPANGAGR